jgi:hypothetical protein
VIAKVLDWLGLGPHGHGHHEHLLPLGIEKGKEVRGGMIAVPLWRWR